MQITVVSTYPAAGSQNIGDALITQATCAALQDVIGAGEQLAIKTVWRADTWENVRPTIESSDFIIFACLAIRPSMETIIYPYLSDIMASQIPYGVLAAGTELDPACTIADQGFSKDTLEILGKISEQSEFFTTRGVLTQEFCRTNQLSKSEF